MILYIYIVYQQIVIYCAEVAGCLQTSAAHLNNLLASGALELLLEIPLVVRIYKFVQVKKEEESNAVTNPK